MLRFLSRKLGVNLCRQEYASINAFIHKPIQYRCFDMENNSYLVILSTSEVQDFYLMRASYQYEKAKILYPENLLPEQLYYGHLNEFYCAVYKYPDKDNTQAYEVYPFKNPTSPFPVDSKILKQIEVDFLSEWPEEFHVDIVRLEIYQEYLKEIRKTGLIEIGIEYGNLVPNNLSISDNGRINLINGHLVKLFQPVGFDEYTWNKTTGSGDIAPNHKLNSIKKQLVDAVNGIVHDLIRPVVLGEHTNPVNADLSSDFIYNRFDLLHKDSYSFISIKDWHDIYYIPIYINTNTAYVGMQLTKISRKAQETIFRYIFDSKTGVNRIAFLKSINRIGKVKQSIHWYIDLPQTCDELKSRLSSKSRYNIQREKRIVFEQLGGFTVEKYSSPYIPDEIVVAYFKFKKHTHGTDYNMQPKEYLEKFYVSDVYVLRIGDHYGAILNSSEQYYSAYLENLTYNPEYEKYSLGKILYDMYLEILVASKKRKLHLGGGDSEYKKKYGATGMLVFSGWVYKNNE